MRFTLPIRTDGDDFWKSEDAAGMAEVEVLPLWMGMLLYGAQEAGRGLAKGAGHKYVKRIPTSNPKRPWRYIYHVGHAGGVGHDEHFVAGAAFKLAHNGKEGHFHIVRTAGDSVTIRHDETGHESTVSKKVLRSMLEQHHAEAIGSHREKLKRDLATVAKHGTEKQRERLAEQARRSGHGDLVDGNERRSPGVRDRGRSDGAALKAKYASGDPKKLAADTPKDQRDRIADALVKDSLDALTAFVAKHPEARKWLNVEFDRLERLDRKHYYVGPEYLEAAIKATRTVDEDFAAIRRDVAKPKGDAPAGKPSAPAADPKAVAAWAKGRSGVQVPAVFVEQQAKVRQWLDAAPAGAKVKIDGHVWTKKGDSKFGGSEWWPDAGHPYHESIDWLESASLAAEAKKLDVVQPAGGGSEASAGSRAMVRDKKGNQYTHIGHDDPGSHTAALAAQSHVLRGNGPASFTRADREGNVLRHFITGNGASQTGWAERTTDGEPPWDAWRHSEEQGRHAKAAQAARIKGDKDTAHVHSIAARAHRLAATSMLDEPNAKKRAAARAAALDASTRAAQV